MSIGRAAWRRFEDMWTVQHPPPMAQLLAAVPEPDPQVMCRLMETRRCPPDGCDGRPCARFETDEPLVPRPALVEPIIPVHHTCEPLTDSTGTTRGRCPACRAWRELAGEDRPTPATGAGGPTSPRAASPPFPLIGGNPA